MAFANPRRRLWIVGLLFLGLATPLVAQETKPVVVVSLASVEETLGDIGYVTNLAGFGDFGKTIALFGGAYTSGMDKKRPSGAIVIPQAGDFRVLTFLPVKDLKMMLETFKERIGEPRDVGDGVLEIGQGQTVYVKEQNGWAYIGMAQDHLKKLPDDPSTYLGELPKKYNIAVKAMVQNIPPELRRVAIDEIKAAFERAMQAQANRGGEFDRELQENVSRTYLKGITDLIEQMDEFTFGFGIDAATKAIIIDTVATYKPGSALASQMAEQGKLTSNFGGFLLPDAALKYQFTAKLSKQDVEQVLGLFKDGRKTLQKAVDDDPSLDPASRETVKEAAGMLLDVGRATLEAGRMDGSLSLLLAPKSVNFIFGIQIADGAKADKAMRMLLETAKKEKDAPEMKFDAVTIGNSRFHELLAKIPEKEAEARDILGESLRLLLGTSANAFYFGFGKQGETLLKQGIEQSAAKSSTPVSPGMFQLSLLPVAKFAASVNDNADITPIIDEVIATFEAEPNSDKITVSSKVIPNGGAARVEISDGILKAFGNAFKKSGARVPGAF